MGSNPSKTKTTVTEIKQNSVDKVNGDGDNTAKEKQNDVTLVVIAIDFGTVHSGFAYSFKGNEQEVTSAKHGSFLEEDRVPTVVLLNPDQTFHSFGYTAQRSYLELDQDKRQNYFYVEQFKMALYKTNKISREIDIHDITGKPIRAMKVFSLAFENLKNLARKALDLAKLDIPESSIQWMITIPAISSDSARQFMRESARDGGIPENQLRLVLEPEAAALYCQQKTLVANERLCVGFKYLLADLGGGTSDLCVHEVLDDGKLREVYRATGEIAGGTGVDAEFVRLMKELVGEQVWAKFKSDYLSAYIDLIKNFHNQKIIFSSPYRQTALRMEHALLHVLDEKKEHSLQVKIKESRFASKMEYSPIEARFNIHCDLMELFFKPSLDGIVDLMTDILKVCTGDINTLLLVGRLQ